MQGCGSAKSARSLFGFFVPVLDRGDVGHSPVFAVPAVEPIHAKGPEAGGHVGDDDQAIFIADIDPESPVDHGIEAVVVGSKIPPALPDT